MGLISYLKAQLNQQIAGLGFIKRDALVSQSTLFGSEIYPGQQYDVYANYTQTALYQLAITNYPVYRNITLLSKMIAGGRINTEIRDKSSESGWKIESDHDFTHTIDYRPNPYMSQSIIWMYQVQWLLLAGEAYWLLFKNGMGELAEVYPLPANRVKPIPDPITGIASFAYTPLDGNYPTFIKPEQICYHRLPNPFDYWRGMSPLSAYLLGLKINTEAQKHDLEDYVNRLNLQHLIMLRAGMPDREFNVAVADIKASNDAGLRWKVMRAGDAKVEQTSQARNEYSAEVYRITEAEADYIYGVPSAYWKQESAYKAGDYQNQLINDTVWPLMNLLSEDLTVQMVSRYYGDEYRAMFEDPRPRNIELDLQQKESDRVTQTYNEARVADGLKEHPDPDIGLAPVGAAVEIAKIKVQNRWRIGEAIPEPEPVPEQLTDTGDIEQEETEQDTENLEEEEVMIDGREKAILGVVFVPEGILYLDDPLENEIVDELEDEEIEVSLNGRA